MRLSFGQLCWTGRLGSKAIAKLRPLRLEVGQRGCMQTFRFGGLFGAESFLLFELADDRAQFFWHRLAEPINASLGMFPGSRHRKGHCTTRLYHSGSSKALILRKH